MLRKTHFRLSIVGKNQNEIFTEKVEGGVAIITLKKKLPALNPTHKDPLSAKFSKN